NGTSNLRASRKAQSAARRAINPTAEDQAAAKPAPAKAAAKRAPAKKAAPKAAAKAAPAKKAAATTSDKPQKLRWVFPDGFANSAETGQTATFGAGELAMLPGEGGWRATYTEGGVETVLGEGLSQGRAYSACVAHSKGQAPAKTA